ncbi:MAG TPA: TIGR03086 family metal-binding protein [Acidimicrobiales bacterium]|nr:TIGR03086 family metal-binding protein [Acidimicrobiales bacterium]
MSPGPLTDGERTDTLAAYTSACAFFGERLAEVTELDWMAETGCPDWDVRMLVAHVVTGEALVTRVLRDGGAWESQADPSILGLNPMAAWRGTVLAAIESASVDGVLDAMHPYAVGELPGAVIIGFRVTENLVHGWDLARACGTDIALPEALAERCLDFWMPLAGSAALSGHFGPTVMPPDGAPAGVRLLSLLGRTA